MWHFFVLHPEEMTLLFGTNKSWQGDQSELTVELHSRIIMSPFAAKRLSLLLNNVVQQYENRFGLLGVDIGERGDKKLQWFYLQLHQSLRFFIVSLFTIGNLIYPAALLGVIGSITILFVYLKIFKPSQWFCRLVKTFIFFNASSRKRAFYVRFSNNPLHI